MRIFVRPKTLADHYRTIRIDAVNLKDRLRNIDTDCANLTHWTALLNVVRFDATTLWHFDAAERAPSTTSFATDAGVAREITVRCAGYGLRVVQATILMQDVISRSAETVFSEEGIAANPIKFFNSLSNCRSRKI